MINSYPEAVDQIFGMFKTFFQANAASVVGYVPEIRWQGVEDDSTPDASKFWCRVSQTTVNENQSTLRDDEGVRRYTTAGFVTIQLFCPKSDVEAMNKGRLLSVIARNSFRGKTTTGKVVFRSATIKEMPPESDSLKFNIVTIYEYDEIN